MPHVPVKKENLPKCPWVSPEMFKLKRKKLNDKGTVKRGGYTAEDWSNWEQGSKINLQRKRQQTRAAIAAGLLQAPGLEDIMPTAAGLQAIYEFVALPYATIIKQDSEQVAFPYHERMFQTGTKFNVEKCPWVEIKGDEDHADNRLYASITITGTTSWRKPIERLYEESGHKQTKYLVLSGRHGQLPNTFNPEDKLTHRGIFDDIRDSENRDNIIVYNSGDDFFHQDKQKRNEFMHSHTGTDLGNDVTVEVLDTAKLYDHDLELGPVDDNQNPTRLGAKGTDTRYDQLYHLRRVIQGAQAKGYVVIMAWCFSLHTFTQYDHVLKTNGLKKEEDFISVELLHTSVCDVVEQDFQFAINPKDHPAEKIQDRVNTIPVLDYE